MRWALTTLLALVATVVAQYNVINTPSGGFSVQAGQPFTITWANPSSGNVEIRLTQGNLVQPGDGIELVPSTPASAGTASFNIPAGADLNGQTYNFEIIDLTNPSNPNFSYGFTIAGASGTGSTTASGSMSMTATSNSTMTVTSTGSSSSSSGTASTTHSSSHSSSGSSSASATQSTSAPSSGNGAASLQVGGLLAVAAGLIAVF